MKNQNLEKSNIKEVTHIESRELLDTLQSLYLRRDKRNEFVFPNPITGKPYDNVRRPLARANIKAGISRQIHWHDLRRWGATAMAAMGTPIPIISRHLGHVEVRTTEIYLGLLSEEQRKAQRRFAERFEGNEERVRNDCLTE